MSRRDDAEEIRRRLDEQIESVLDRFFPGWVKRGRKAYLTPKNPKQLGSFQVNLDGPRRGQWYRFSQQIGGGSVELISYALTNGVTAYAQAFREARSFLGMSQEESCADDPEIARRREREAQEARERRARQEEEERRRRRRRALTAADIWSECRPIAGTLAEDYLIGRGLPVPPHGWPDVIGFHKGLEWELGAEWEDKVKVKDGPRFPCLVGRVQGVGGDTIAVWRIYIDPKTRGKAPVPNPKVGFGPAKGGAVRIGGIAPLVGVAEGLETALGAWALIGFKHPVWSGLSTSISSIELPLEVERVRIFPDGDKPLRWRQREGGSTNRVPGVDGEYEPAEPAGRAAARKLHERLVGSGIGCVIEAEPAVGRDYLDIWNVTKELM